MINVSNVSKSFINQNVLKNINLSFPDKGLYFVLGQSGCGKSTLLNCIAGLIDYDGEITINGDNFRLMKDNEISDYRLKNIGFIFQDFKLFQHDTVFDNVALPMQCISTMNSHYQERRVEDILEIVGIKHLINEKISNLSGGEKQRIAIARAMINDPKVLLCDEPTGSLDSVNKISIMTILKTISSTRLVIVVSHDEELTKKYADGIFYLKDGKLFKSVIHENKQEKKFLPIFKSTMPLKESKIPRLFLYRHTKNAIKQRRFRSLITNLMVSFGLLGSGLAFMISDIIYQSVVGMYANIVSDNQIMMTLNASDNVSNQIISADKNDINDVKNIYKEYINDDGICYLANFEEYFKDANNLSLADSTEKYNLSGYSARNINDFEWLENCQETIYPNDIKELKNDEVILSINPEIIRTICYHLRIEKTVDSLANYLLKNKVYLCYDFANFSWQYHDEQILQFKGFVLDRNPIIYHSNHKWNEYMFETMMRMPVNENISYQEYYPWVLKKIHYLHLIDKPEYFLIKSVEDDALNKYVFDIAKKQHFPILLKDKLHKDSKRILMYKNKFLTIYSSDWKYIKSLQKSVKNPIFSTNSGYSVYGTSLLSGFNKVMFFAKNEELLETTTGIFSSNGYDPTASIILPDGVLQGHYTKTSNNGVFFKGIEGENIIGEPPKSLSEIVISKGMANSLFKDESPIGKHLHISLTSACYKDESNKYKSSFNNDELLIVGYVENDKNILYQNDYWSLLYFQCQIGLSAFELLPVGMSMEFDHKSNSNTIIKELEKEFPYYSFFNPMEDIEKQADTLCFYMKIILFVLSIATLLIAICLITICNYLHIVEVKKDIGLIQCIGVSKKESTKILYFHSLFVAITGAITSVFELILLFFALKFGLASMFNLPSQINFNLMPYIFILILSLFIGFIPAYFVNFKLYNLDPLTAMKG